MPSVNVVNGKSIVVGYVGPLGRVRRILLGPFVQSWHHRDLIVAILRREVRERFKGSIGGWIWAVFAPLLGIAVYSFAFTSAVNLPVEAQRGTRVDYALFIFSGLIIFNFFSEIAFRAPTLLHEYTHFIKQTIFPSDMLAVISTLRAAAYSGISMVVMLLFQLVIVGSLPWTVVLLPLVVVPFLAFLMGIAWFLSALGAFTRDAGYAMITIVPFFMFITPVFYPISALPSPLDFWIYGNALTGFVEVTRDIVLLGKVPGAIVYSWTLFTSAATFWFGYWVFDRYRNVIVDVI